MTRGSGCCFVVHQNIDHALASLHATGSDLLQLELAQVAALDHGGAIHANVAAPTGDDPACSRFLRWLRMPWVPASTVAW